MIHCRAACDKSHVTLSTAFSMPSCSTPRFCSRVNSTSDARRLVDIPRSQPARRGGAFAVDGFRALFVSIYEYRPGASMWYWVGFRLAFFSIK